jgi:hypothetical protein
MNDESKPKIAFDQGGASSPPAESLPEDGRQVLINLIEAAEDKHFVFLFGTPASGKTAVLGTMLQAMQRPEVRGKLYVHGEGGGYFREGLALWKRIMESFAKKEFPPRSSAGSTIQLHAQYVPPDQSPIHLIFLEMAGEDLRQVMVTDAGGRSLPFHVGQFLKIPTLKISFLVTTSWAEAKKDDAAIDDFVSFLSEFSPHLMDNRFILLVTKWDTYSNRTDSIDDFVRKHMPRTYNKLAARRNVIQPFSVGTVVTYAGAGGDVISSFDHGAAQRLFGRVFETFTGISSAPPKSPWWMFWK